MTNEKLRRIHNMLVEYREQLETRHRTEPLKSPPLFLLNQAIEALLPAFVFSKKKKRRIK